MNDPDPIRSDDAGTDRIGRDTLLIAGLTAVSRVTGFGRIVVVAAVLGTGLLGDVYQSANTVPNIVFELLAGGALQAALVPMFVKMHRDGGEARFARTVGLVGGSVAAGLAVVAAVVMVTAPLLARTLSSAEPDASVVDDKVALSTWLLVVFAPQIVFYGLGLVSSAALQARRRFAAAAIAPAVNNIVVIVAYLVFDTMRGDASPSLALTAGEIAVLAGGTTLAVVAFTSVPVIALVRATDEPLAPRVAFADPAMRSVMRVGGWAVLQVAGTLALTAGALVIGNGAVGGVAVFALALAVFMLPYALLAAPVATAALPRLARHHHDGDGVAFGVLVRRSIRRILVPSTVAAVGLAVLAWPIARAVVFGNADELGPAPVAHALMAFAVGVVPYGLHHLLTRVLMSRGEVRAAAAVSVVTAVVGLVLMVVLADVFAPSERAAALALAYSCAHVAGLAALVPLVNRPARSVTATGVGTRPEASPCTAVELLGPSTGGIRRHVMALGDDLRSAGWSVVIAGPQGVIDGIREVPVPNGVSWSAVRRARRTLAEIVAEVRPTVVHAHGLKAGWVAIGVRGDTRVVLTVHNVVLDEGARGVLLRFLERRVVGAVDMVIATSQEISQRLGPVARSIVVVTPVHEVPQVQAGSDEIRHEMGVTGPLVVSVARLHRQKDHDTLIAAMASVAQRRPDATLALVGDGPERERLVDRAARLVPSSAVRFLGDRRDAVDVMAAADVVVISSSWESGPLTLLEAGSVSAPLVSTPVGFVPDIVHDGVEGLLVPIGDVGAMAQAIMDLVDDPQRARSLGRALHRAVSPRLDRARSCRAVIAAYDGGTPVDADISDTDVTVEPDR